MVFLGVFFNIPVCLGQDDDFDKANSVFDGGFILGTNISKLEGDTYQGFHKIGLNLGGTVYIHFNRSLGISMELLYAQKGARGAHVTESLALGTYFDKYYLNLNYAEIPLLLHVKKFVFFDFEAGLAYARLITSKEWAEADVPVFIDPELARFNKTEISFLGGASVQLSRHWYGNMRLQYSAGPVRPWERVPPRYSDYRGQYKQCSELSDDIHAIAGANPLLLSLPLTRQ